MGTLNLRIPKLRTGSFFPEGAPRAPPARQPRARRGGGRDVRHQRQEGAEDSREDGRREARQGPRERNRRNPRRRDSRPRGGALDARDTLHPARRDLRQVPPLGPRGYDRSACVTELVASDAHGGLVWAIGEVFQGAAWQRCAVRLTRGCMREAGS